MASYSLRIIRSAERELRAIAEADVARILNRIQSLADDPGPLGCMKLSGAEGWRIRQGDWRVVYRVDDAAREVLVGKVGHRREVYR